MSNTINIIKSCYADFKKKNEDGREHFNRAITLTEKILTAHMRRVCGEEGEKLTRKKSYAMFYPDRVAMQDATAQMAILQFINTGKSRVSVSSTVHCDHLIQARRGLSVDIEKAKKTNEEVYGFLKSASRKYGIGFWGPNSGIIHQVVLENYAFPGGMMLGTDSHTPNAGGLGMISIGVGGADVVDVLAGQAFSLKWPGIIGVRLTGSLDGWASPKDIILKLMSILTVKGGTGSVVEFFGEGCGNISATGKATIANMGAEHGATTSIFPYDATMSDYLKSTNRKDWDDLAKNNLENFKADEEIEKTPEKFYDSVIEINLSKLEPQIAGPHSPDIVRSIKNMKKDLKEENFPNKPSAALIGSCTNSSYEDLGKAAFLAEFAAKNKIKIKTPLYITPGSESVFDTAKRDGQIASLQRIGAVILSNACGPCIGQWFREDIKEGERNSIISSYNRNFPGRNDGNRETLSFISSPEVVLAMALSGDLAFDPIEDSIELSNGKKIKLPVPKSPSLPSKNMEINTSGYVPPAENGEDVVIEISPNSERLSLLERFQKWDGNDFLNLKILLKAKGKCTTDHISQAGIWLKFRGHLDKISNNTYIGAINSFCDEPGKGIDLTETQQIIKSLPEIARIYKKKNIPWVVIGDYNFGEGSSREHAAMQPRYLGCKAIISRSFARIHETNLKKHGILPLVFKNSDDYNAINQEDELDILNIKDISPGSVVKVKIRNKNGNEKIVNCDHSLSAEQIKWFKEGSALNYLGSI